MMFLRNNGHGRVKITDFQCLVVDIDKSNTRARVQLFNRLFRANHTPLKARRIMARLDDEELCAELLKSILSNLELHRH